MQARAKNFRFLAAIQIYGSGTNPGLKNKRLELSFKHIITSIW